MKTLAAAGVAASLVLTLAACGGDTASDPSEKLSGPIRVGVSGELSGAAAQGGESLRMGVELATEMINRDGGIAGRKVELVIRDTEMNPSRGVSIIREFASDDEVLASIGGYLSTVALAQAPIVAQEELPHFVTTSNVPKSVDDAMPWGFGVRMNAFTTARYAIDFAKQNFGATKWAILHESGGYGQAGVAAMTAELKKDGAAPAAVEVFNLDDRDMSSQVGRARASGADAVYLFGIGASNGYVLREMGRIGWDPVVIGESGAAPPAMAEVAGEAANDVYVIQTANFAAEQQRPVTAELLDRARAKYGNIPPLATPSAQAFDAALLLFEAIRAVKLTGEVEDDRAAIREALESLDTTVEGAISDWKAPFAGDDHEAVTVDDYLMNVWQGGKLVVSDKQ